MLSRIRNASSVGLEKVLVPYTRINFAIVQILKEEGFVDSFDKIRGDNALDFISINLKFKKGLKQKPYISFLKRVSRPGLRVYVNSHNIPRVWGGIGVAVLFSINTLTFHCNNIVY